ncbi:MtrAB system histidine kinase MtrB [Ornithinimicrobium flavum]|uniref:MtrAB system histidine kinase MtrB n=1 Tax=Ornithinimicrobium flavum TaxID=1288636 RepID=UPI0010704D74|nr:MtrAB system histidine kinase MtrB [Ornithinimicrobium flavum]
MLVGTVLALLLGTFLYQRVARGLVEQAVDNAQRDAAQQVSQAQEAFDSTDRTDDFGLRTLAREQIDTMVGTSADDGRRVLLLPALENDPAPVVEAMWIGLSTPQAPPGLQEAVSADPENQQTIVVPVALDGQETPVTATVIGSRVTLPRAGAYDLLLVYSLEREQQTLALVRQLFLGGGGGLVLLMAGLAVVATRMVTRPVAKVAHVSQQLARGMLDERVPVHGHDEIAQLATSFNTMADSLQHQIRELRSLSQLQQRFVSDVSHELRTPLTTMRMAADVLHSSREDFPLPVARSAELLDQELDRFEELLSELLEISRFDSGAVTLERHEEDLVALVQAAVDGVRPLADRLGSELVLHLPAAPVPVQMDGRRISRVLRNLLTNAVEHGEGRPVEVVVAATPQVASCSVRDHGIGLTTDQQQHVFDRFWRADTSRARTTGGTGLGLAIALEDARVHGGWLQVGSAPGQGACFRLLLPRSATYVIADEPAPVPPPAPAPSPAPHEVRAPVPVAARAPGRGAESRPLPEPVPVPGPSTPEDAFVPPVTLALAAREERP